MNYTENYRRSLEECVKKIPDYRKLFGKKVLITGGTGMIGSAVVELLYTLNRTEQAEITIYLAGRNQEKVQKRFEGFMQEEDYIFLPYDAAKTTDLSVILFMEHVMRIRQLIRRSRWKRC